MEYPYNKQILLGIVYNQILQHSTSFILLLFVFGWLVGWLIDWFYMANHDLLHTKVSLTIIIFDILFLCVCFLHYKRSEFKLVLFRYFIHCASFCTWWSG